MRGICGVFGYKKEPPQLSALISLVMNVLHHRGSDGWQQPYLKILTL